MNKLALRACRVLNMRYFIILLAVAFPIAAQNSPVDSPLPTILSSPRFGQCTEICVPSAAAQACQDDLSCLFPFLVSFHLNSKLMMDALILLNLCLGYCKFEDGTLILQILECLAKACPDLVAELLPDLTSLCSLNLSPTVLSSASTGLTTASTGPPIVSETMITAIGESPPGTVYHPEPDSHPTMNSGPNHSIAAAALEATVQWPIVIVIGLACIAAW